MAGWLEAAFAKYGWILIGLSFGFLAKYALLIKRGARIRWLLVLADILLLPLVALIAFHLANQLGTSGETSALVSAFSAVGADRLVKLLTDRFFKQVETEVRAIAAEQIGVARQMVQTEISSAEIINDTLAGKAPASYAALRPHPDTEN